MQSGRTAWLPDIAGKDKPVYLAIADRIAEDIRDGRLVPGQRLPPQRTLAGQLGLDFTTISRAYAEARRRGLLDARVGQGTFVRAAESPAATATATAAAAAERAEDGGFIDMTMNQPPLPEQPELLERVRRGMVQAAALTDLRDLLRYPDMAAGTRDRAAGLRWLGRRLPGLAAERLVVCPGTQSALLALLTLLALPGDTVCAEAVTYPGFKAAARQLGLTVAGVPLDERGLDPDALREAFRRHRPKALYCTPTLHNPTTATMDAERRQAIAALAREHGVPVIEDDIYGVLPTEAEPPIAALAPDMTFHLAGLAKCVAPGLRITYVAAPDARQAARLAGAQRATVLATPPLLAAVATRWIEDGTAGLMLDAIRTEATARQRLAAALLPAGHALAHPEGFHLWLRLPSPWTRGEFATHLRARGIAAVPSDAFAVTGPGSDPGSAAPPEALRICLGAPNGREETRRMLGILAEALDQTPAMAGGVI